MAPPIMDLSSLEGPPIIEPEYITLPSTTSRLLCQQTPLPPNDNTRQILLPGGLPPRPRSADAISSRRHQRRQPDQSFGRNTDPSRIGMLRRAAARRGRRGEEIQVECAAQRDECSRSPHNSSNTQINEFPRQPPVCNDLVWLEDEQLWIMVDTTNSQSPPNRQGSRATPPSSHPSSSSSEHPRDDNENDDLPLNESPPPYESHGFTPSYIMRSTHSPASRWMAVAQRMHGVPTA